MREKIERHFELTKHGTTIGREMLAGTTTFLTMAYIIFLQPMVLTGQIFGMDTGMDFGAVTTATCLSAALATAIMALWARLPIAQAPGMGENFFFVLTAIPAAAALGHPEPWRTALGAVFIAGILFLVLSLTGIRRWIVDAVSPSLKHGMATGIGLLIAFIGLKNAGIVTLSPAAPSLNTDFVSPDRWVFAIGLLTTGVFLARKMRGAVLAGIVAAAAATFLFWAAWPHLPEGWRASESIANSQLATRFPWDDGVFALPSSMVPTLFKMDILGALSLSMLPLVLVFLFMDVFDTMGTLVGVCDHAGLSRDGKIPAGNRAFLSDAAGTVAGAAMGTSTVTSFIESAAGVEQGGRTGLTALTTAALFIAALFISPIVAMVASYPPMTAPALFAVGALMMKSVTRIEWDDFSEALPAFIILIGIPLTFSVGDGLALGLLSYPVIKFLSNRGREVKWPLYVLAAALLLYFLFVRGNLG